MLDNTRLPDVLFGLNLRPYQEDLLEAFETQRVSGDRVFHFLAPPGSGKTIMGLEMICRLGHRALILSPNSAIQGQWQAKLEMLTDELHMSTSVDDADSPLADMLSLTYQQISVKDHSSGELHANARQLLDSLESRPVIVLDECHHLTSYWAEIVTQLAAEGRYIIGLTATPPIHRENAALMTYEQLLGPVDYQIPLPAIIKDGFLAPFQDLVYITQASQEELAAIKAADSDFTACFEALENLPAGDGPTPLNWFAWGMLEDFRLGSGSALPFDEALQKYPDLCIALARYTSSHIGDLPPEVILTDEMEDEPGYEDLVLVLGAYVAYLDKRDDEESQELHQRIVATMKGQGYTLSGNFFIRQGKRGNTLGSSTSKLAGMTQILYREMDSMGDELRALVLTDFEGEHDVPGSSAVAALQTLTSDPRCDDLDPILVTGRTILVDDDLAPLFLELAKGYADGLGLKLDFETSDFSGYHQIHANGSGWSTRVYVHFITQLLEDGVTRCIIGTRALLGEGWDSIKLNTLIDLTHVSTYVTVNQIRGRTLRHDAENHFKVANNWDVLTLADDPNQGFRDLERFSRKHAQFYGLSEDGVIEKGVGHVHPVFTNEKRRDLWLRSDELNTVMLDRATERQRVHGGWKIGKGYRNVELVSIDIIPSRETTAPRIAAADTRKLAQIHRKIRGGRQRTGALLLLLLFPLHISLESFSRSLGLPAIVVTAGVATVTYLIAVLLLAVLASRDKGWMAPVTLEDSLHAFGRVVLKSLQDIGQLSPDFSSDDIQILLREDGDLRIFLPGDDASIFATAMGELIDPVQNQRYIVESCETELPTRWFDWLRSKPRYHHGSWYPVPSIFGASRKTADQFHRNWKREVSPGRILYTRRGEGREIVAGIFRRKGIGASKRRKDIWL